MRFIALLALCLLLQPAVVVDAAAADAYPAKALRLIVPFPPGGPADALARLVGDKLSASLGKAVVVDNRPGAGGNIGMELGAKSAADGHTLVLAPAGNLTVNPFLYRNVPYDVGRDFARYAKAHPGTLNYSSPGNGSGAHLAGELLKSTAGIDIVHIAFNGIAPAVTAVVGGQVQMMFAGAPSALPQVKAGRLVALGVAGPKRIATAPDLPTLAESGLPGFDVTSWYSIVVPAGTPSYIVARLHSEIAAALRQPDVQEKLAGLGAEPIGNTPAEFAAMIQVETAKWGKIVKDANIQLE